VSAPTTPDAPLSEIFAASLKEFDSPNTSPANVSIERGAELVRADRDGRAHKE